MRLPKREVARILLAWVRLLLLDLVGPLPAQPSVLGISLDAEVDVAVGLVGEPSLDKLLDHRDLVGDRLDGCRFDVRSTEA